MIITATGWGVHLKYTGGFNGEGFFLVDLGTKTPRSCFCRVAQGIWQGRLSAKQPILEYLAVDVRKCSTAVRDG